MIIIHYAMRCNNRPRNDQISGQEGAAANYKGAGEQWRATGGQQ